MEKEVPMEVPTKVGSEMIYTSFIWNNRLEGKVKNYDTSFSISWHRLLRRTLQRSVRYSAIIEWLSMFHRNI